MSTINVEIVSAEGHIFSGEANMDFAPARGGDVGVAPRHAPMLADLRPGELRVDVVGGEEQFFYVTGGLLEVQPHLVTVLADTALRGEQLDEDAAKAAQDAAEAAVSAADDKQSLEHARMQLVEASARYNAVQKLKGKRT